MSERHAHKNQRGGRVKDDASRCTATTTRGARCPSRALQDGLCYGHLKQRQSKERAR